MGHSAKRRLGALILFRLALLYANLLSPVNNHCFMASWAFRNKQALNVVSQLLIAPWTAYFVHKLTELQHQLIAHVAIPIGPLR